MVKLASGVDCGCVHPTTKNKTDAVEHGGHILAQRQEAMVYTIQIGHPCSGQMRPVKTSYSLISIMCPYHGLKFRAADQV